MKASGKISLTLALIGLLVLAGGYFILHSALEAIDLKTANLIVWVALALEVIALICGFMDAKSREGKNGLILSIIAILFIVIYFFIAKVGQPTEAATVDRTQKPAETNITQ